MIAAPRTCLQCHNNFNGRSDKKFCNDSCRNAYNNLQNSDCNSYMRYINYQLRRNRRILEANLSRQKHNSRTTRYKLTSQGYRFNYFTHTYTNRKGQLFHFCYEYGYHLLENENIMIIKRKENEKTGSISV